MLQDVIAELVPGTPIHDLDATDPVTAERLRVPGSPTIRVDGRDVDPSYIDPGDYTPRCRLYRTESGLRGLPERRWIEDALRGAEPIPANDPDGDRSTSGSAVNELGLFAAGTAALTAACCLTIALMGGLAIAPIGAAVVAVAAAGAGAMAINKRRRRTHSSE